MATQHKLSELIPSLQTANADALLYIVTDPTGSPSSNSITVKSLFESNLTANVAANGSLVVSQYAIANVVISNYNQTPAASNNVPAGFANGAMWSDGSYLYVVANSNTVMRVALSSW